MPQPSKRLRVLVFGLGLLLGLIVCSLPLVGELLYLTGPVWLHESEWGAYSIVLGMFFLACVLLNTAIGCFSYAIRRSKKEIIKVL